MAILEAQTINFGSLHRHDTFSVMDGFGTPDQCANIAKQLGYTHLGITNHGNLNGAIRHINACKAQNIIPVIGIEIYFAHNGFDVTSRGNYSHLCLFAKNPTGYKNLCKLQTLSEQYKYYKQQVTIELLQQYSEGIICTSACCQGVIQQSLINNDFKNAIKFSKLLQSIFQDNFYLEIQPLELREKGVTKRLIANQLNLANKLQIKCIVTLDDHYPNKDIFTTYQNYLLRKGVKYDIQATYSNRYMRNLSEVQNLLKLYIPQNNIISTIINNTSTLLQNIEDNILPIITDPLPKII